MRQDVVGDRTPFRAKPAAPVTQSGDEETGTFGRCDRGNLVGDTAADDPRIRRHVFLAAFDEHAELLVRPGHANAVVRAEICTEPGGRDDFTDDVNQQQRRAEPVFQP